MYVSPADLSHTDITCVVDWVLSVEPDTYLQSFLGQGLLKADLGQLLIDG